MTATKPPIRAAQRAMPLRSDLSAVTSGPSGPDPANPAMTGQMSAPMTELQIVELRDLADRVGEPFAANLTRQEAQERIGFLRARL